MKLQIILVIFPVLACSSQSAEVWTNAFYGREFKYFGDKVTWISAKLTCEKIGFQLAMLSPGEKLIRSFLGSENVYLGAVYDGVKVSWIDGTNMTGFNSSYLDGKCCYYKNWDVNCATCENRFPFLCAKTNGIHHPYFDWFSANAVYDLISCPSGESESKIRAEKILAKFDEISNKLDQLLKK